MDLKLSNLYGSVGMLQNENFYVPQISVVRKMMNMYSNASFAVVVVGGGGVS